MASSNSVVILTAARSVCTTRGTAPPAGSHLCLGRQKNALSVTEQLGAEESGGMVRVGIAHYNTAEEVDRLLAVVNGMVLR
jgi:selenocysteine lyase/cysteine desulfurase